MNTVFSLKRIGLILRADWIENRKNWAITVGLLLVAYVFLLWDRSFVQKHLIGWTIFIAAILFFKFVERKVHGSKGLFLTLPASNLEKFVALWAVGLFYLASCLLIFWGVISVNNLISGHPAIELFRTVPATGVVAVTVFFTCWLFASYMTFRKNAGAIGIALLVALVAAFVRLMAELGTIKLLRSYDWGEAMGSLFHHYYIVAYLLSAGLLYYSYWRLTKKQIR